jgi:uncharacterized protein (DUF1778 family)
MPHVLKKVRISKTQTPASESKARTVRDRLNCRIDGRIKARAEEAALVLGQDLTAFTEMALDEKAQKVLDREERIVLSERDFDRFVEIINAATPPTPSLVEARKAYRKLQAEFPDNNF